MKLVPIVLAHTPDEFESQLQKVLPLGTQLNFDIADGSITPQKTVDLTFLLARLKLVPDIQKFKLDFDLMIKDWRVAVSQLIQATATLNLNSVVIHQKYYKDPPVADFDIGVALDLDDEINPKIISRVSVVQIMTVELGAQGTPFHPEALAKITDLRTSGYEGKIVIDGGVNDQTLPLIMENKGLPDILGVGGYFTHAQNPPENYKTLDSILTHYEI